MTTYKKNPIRWDAYWNDAQTHPHHLRRTIESKANDAYFEKHPNTNGAYYTVRVLRIFRFLVLVIEKRGEITPITLQYIAELEQEPITLLKELTEFLVEVGVIYRTSG